MSDERKRWALEALRQRTAREPSEFLRELYVDRRLSQTEIAEAIGVTRNTVSTWLREFAIRRSERTEVVL